jgi:hypothetical protein
VSGLVGGGAEDDGSHCGVWNFAMISWWDLIDREVGFFTALLEGFKQLRLIG